MKSQLKHLLFVGCLSLFLFLSSAVGDEPTAGGKALFTEHKCAKCHKVEKELPKAEAPAEDEWGMGESDDKSGPPNLWDVGSSLQDSEWLAKYLKKEVAKDGTKHKLKFKGSKEELVALTEWLIGLKGEAVADTTKACSHGTDCEHCMPKP